MKKFPSNNLGCWGGGCRKIGHSSDQPPSLAIGIGDPHYNHRIVSIARTQTVDMWSDWHFCNLSKSKLAQAQNLKSKLQPTSKTQETIATIDVFQPFFLCKLMEYERGFQYVSDVHFGQPCQYVSKAAGVKLSICFKGVCKFAKPIGRSVGACES